MRKKFLSYRASVMAVTLSASLFMLSNGISASAAGTTTSVNFGTTITGTISKASNSVTKAPSYSIGTDKNGNKVLNISDPNDIPGTVYIRVSQDPNSKDEFKIYNGSLDLKEGVNYIWSYIIGDDGTKSDVISWTVVKKASGDIDVTKDIDTSISYTPPSADEPSDSSDDDSTDSDDDNVSDSDADNSSDSDYDNDSDSDADNSSDSDADNDYSDTNADADNDNDGYNGTDSDNYSNTGADPNSDSYSGSDDNAYLDKLPQTGTTDPKVYQMGGFGLSALGIAVIALSGRKNKKHLKSKNHTKYSA